jgi:hypothetical protein
MNTNDKSGKEDQDESKRRMTKGKNAKKASRKNRNNEREKSIKKNQQYEDEC